MNKRIHPHTWENAVESTHNYSNPISKSSFKSSSFSIEMQIDMHNEINIGWMNIEALEALKVAEDEDPRASFLLIGGGEGGFNFSDRIGEG